MANHKSSIKRIRQTETRRLRNKYNSKSTRTVIKNLKAAEKKKEAEELLVKATSMIDKLAKKNIIHKNKAANLKSKLTKHVNTLK